MKLARHARMQLLVAFAGAAALLGLFVRMRGALGPEPAIPLFVMLGLTAGAIYFLSLYGLEHSADQRRATIVILLSALLLRLLLAPTVPVLSNDIYRYRFDGQVQALGWNPYLVEPDDPRFGTLQVPSIRSIPGYNIRGVYPPLSELVFRWTWRILPSPAAFKTPFILADCLVLAMLAFGAFRGQLRNWQLAAYGWNPLLVVEFAASGHNDALALVLMVAAVLLLDRRTSLSLLLLTAAALAKLFPITLVPLWLRRLGWPRRNWSGVAASLVLVALCLWPYWSALRQFPITARQYEASFHGQNSSLNGLIQVVSGHRELSLGTGLGIVAGLALWFAARPRRPMVAAAAVFAAIPLVSPTAYPWYFTWAVPFVILAPSPLSVPWLLLTVLQFLSYNVLIGYFTLGAWKFDRFILVLTYAPFYTWLLVRAFYASRRGCLPQAGVAAASGPPGREPGLRESAPPEPQFPG